MAEKDEYLELDQDALDEQMRRHEAGTLPPPGTLGEAAQQRRAIAAELKARRAAALPPKLPPQSGR